MCIPIYLLCIEYQNLHSTVSLCSGAAGLGMNGMLFYTLMQARARAQPQHELIRILFLVFSSPLLLLANNSDCFVSADELNFTLK